jgi:hypothetical protein
MTTTTAETPITMLLLLFQTTINNHHRYQAFRGFCRFSPDQWPAGNATPQTFSSDRNFDFATTGTPMPQRGRSVYSTIAPPRTRKAYLSDGT